MEVETVIFRCDCQTMLVAEIPYHGYSGGNICPRCQIHIVVQRSKITKRGVAIFVNIRKDRPYRKVHHQIYREWQEEQMRSFT